MKFSVVNVKGKTCFLFWVLFCLATQKIQICSVSFVVVTVHHLRLKEMWWYVVYEKRRFEITHGAQMCKKDKTQVSKQSYEVFSYVQSVTTLFDRACMYMNISYIYTFCMCKLNTIIEWRNDWERGVGGDGVCGCFLGEPLSDLFIYSNTCLKIIVCSPFHKKILR